MQEADMGTWAVDAFGNDDAVDWAYGLEEVKDDSLIRTTLDAVLDAGEEYLEASQAANALAAIEAIARLQGNGGFRNTYTKDVDQWVERHRPAVQPALAKQAHAVIQRILADNSELKDLWQESDEFDEWLAAVQELKTRVRA
jgi:hypothetical protein